jgi:chromosome segregation ATPase
MRTLKSILLAGAMLLAIPAFFSSCQEDAPQIDYTMSVTVTNDFSKVVEAINNGTLKNEQAIAKLTAAIDKMNADQQTKLQAIKDVLNSVNATIDTKLAAIEAAMKAQTLSLEGKLALIEAAMKAQTLTIEKKCDAIVAAIKGLPDYTAKLAAIETAIKALPNYEEQLKALNTLIEAQNSKLDDQIAALEGIMNAIPDYSNKLSAIENAIKAMPDYDAAINGIKDEIANLVKEVKDGNKSEADALAEITKKIEALKAAGGGDSGTSKMEYVDLGLSVKWAKCNLGAKTPEEWGDLYCWAETEPRSECLSLNCFLNILYTSLIRIY